MRDSSSLDLNAERECPRLLNGDRCLPGEATGESLSQSDLNSFWESLFLLYPRLLDEWLRDRRRVCGDFLEFAV